MEVWDKGCKVPLVGGALAVGLGAGGLGAAAAAAVAAAAAHGRRPVQPAAPPLPGLTRLRQLHGYLATKHVLPVHPLARPAHRGAQPLRNLVVSKRPADCFPLRHATARAQPGPTARGAIG